MSVNAQLVRRQAEQKAFDAQLDGLLQEHLGKWTVFESERPVGFFGSYGEAFSFGLALFGGERVFLVSKVVDPPWKLVGLELAELLRAA